jgi:hypothetical protein
MGDPSEKGILVWHSCAGRKRGGVSDGGLYSFVFCVFSSLPTLLSNMATGQQSRSGLMIEAESEEGRPNTGGRHQKLITRSYLLCGCGFGCDLPAADVVLRKVWGEETLDGLFPGGAGGRLIGELETVVSVLDICWHHHRHRSLCRCFVDHHSLGCCALLCATCIAGGGLGGSVSPGLDLALTRVP